MADGTSYKPAFVLRSPRDLLEQEFARIDAAFGKRAPGQWARNIPDDPEMEGSAAFDFSDVRKDEQ